MLIRGRIQKSNDVIHVVANTIEDKTSWLALLTQEGAQLKNPLAYADEAVRPSSDQRQTALRHPRQVRVIPKSRDFH
jgi:error-prone DNA polymerase